jgi:WXXGXW repeat (2 copies)
MTKNCSRTPYVGCWVTLAAVATVLTGCVAPVANEEVADTGYEESGTDGTVLDAPPLLPDDDQPPCPQDGYVWIPGYWAYQSRDLGGGTYYWVPGAWVQPPQVGVLWTPGYWSYAGGGFFFHAGHWGPHVGFYGGINYGHGYPGNYDTTFHSNAPGKASYNGVGGVIAGPSAREREFAEEPRVGATVAQQARAQQAARSPALIAHVTAKPGAIDGSTQAMTQARVTYPKNPPAPKPTSGHTSTDKTGISP